MHQIQVDVVQSEVLEGGIEPFGHALVPGIVKLGSNPDLFARYTRGTNAFSHLRFVAISQSRVDVAVTDREGVLDCFCCCVLGRLPGS